MELQSREQRSTMSIEKCASFHMTTAFQREGGVRCGADIDNTAVQICTRICLRTTCGHNHAHKFGRFGIRRVRALYSNH